MPENNNKIIPAVFVGLFFFILIFPQKIFSADFTINPIRVFLNSSNMTEVITIKNGSDKNLTLQLNAFEWQQDSDGKDKYFSTKDLVFFPKIFRISGGGEKIIRLGTRVPQGRNEKTYRLYFEEVPEPLEAKTTAVRILLKIGVPVFISPVKAESKGRIESIEINRGTLNIAVKNEGNNHFVVKKIKVDGFDDSGEEVFSTEIGGWYLHGGVSRVFSVNIPVDDCLKIKTLNVNIDTDKLSIDEKVDVSKEMCGS
jgi:fimbrial chaperone protein